MDSGGGGGEVGEVPHVLADDGLAAVGTRWFVSRYSPGIRRSRASGYDRVQGRHRFGADRVADHVDPAGSSGAAGTPTFFLSGPPPYDTYDIDTLTAVLNGKGSAEPSPEASYLIKVKELPDGAMGAGTPWRS
jgi:hypothetical protein